jgi:hypothetical protein
LTLPIQGDVIVEADESFIVTLSNPSSSVRLEVAAAGGVVVNDDGDLNIAAVEAAQFEGDSSPTKFTYLVTRTGDTSQPVTVDFAVAGSGANPADAADFGGTLPSGTVAFAAGEGTHVVTFDAVGDLAFEPDEHFAITLANPAAGATLGIALAGGPFSTTTALSTSVIDAAP